MKVNIEIANEIKERESKNPSKTIAVDFDGTLCEHIFPYIGKPDLSLIGKLINFKKNGGKLILWTCREGKYLKEAVKWCETLGLIFDAVNENINKEYCKEWEFAQHKIVADYYLDDRNILIEQFKDNE